MRIIFPEKNTTIVFDNLDSKLIECKASGSLQPKISWVHGDASNTSVMLGGDIVKRIHVVDVSAYTLQLYIISPVPYIDAGKYTCVVENEWEVVNRSVTIKFELLRGGKSLEGLLTLAYTPIHKSYYRTLPSYHICSSTIHV